MQNGQNGQNYIQVKNFSLKSSLDFSLFCCSFRILQQIELKFKIKKKHFIDKANLKSIHKKDNGNGRESKSCRAYFPRS